MNLQKLIGKQVTAIGDCGIKKDQKVCGILVVHTQNETIIENRYLNSVNPNTVKPVKIWEKNLNNKNFTNREIIVMLTDLSLQLDACGFNRVLDVIEDLTGNRDFSL